MPIIVALYLKSLLGMTKNVVKDFCLSAGMKVLYYTTLISQKDLISKRAVIFWLVIPSLAKDWKKTGNDRKCY